MTRFYKKISPSVLLYLASGRPLQFDKVDTEWGVLQVGNEAIQAELAECIKREVGGVSEISEAEYKAELQKKTILRPAWRDELSKQAIAASARQSRAVPVDAEGRFTPPPAPVAPPPPTPSMATGKVQANYRPNASPRRN